MKTPDITTPSPPSGGSEKFEFMVYAADAQGQIDDIPDRVTVYAAEDFNPRNKPSVQLEHGRGDGTYDKPVSYKADQIHYIPQLKGFVVQDLHLDLDRSGTPDPDLADAYGIPPFLSGSVALVTGNHNNKPVYFLAGLADGLTDCCSSENPADLRKDAQKSRAYVADNYKGNLQNVTQVQGTLLTEPTFNNIFHNFADVNGDGRRDMLQNTIVDPQAPPQTAKDNFWTIVVSPTDKGPISQL